VKGVLFTVQEGAAAAAGRRLDILTSIGARKGPPANSVTAPHKGRLVARSRGH